MDPVINPPAKSSPFRGVTLFRPTMKWRAQISANGKTTSLGDHDTEEQAATAFDRASISKAGRRARTNFPLEKYENEIDELEGMDLNELVAMLRSKAKKHGAQTSHFRGVSLLKQTKKWHAQINVGGKQVHLGFFPTEEFAARAYDRAAINKGAKENTVRIVTNFEFAEYADELAFLRQVDQHDLIDALATESKRRQTRKNDKVEALQPLQIPFLAIASNLDLFKKAERAHPKATLRNRLYEDFGKKGAKEQTSEGELEARQAGNASESASRAQTASAPGPVAMRDESHAVGGSDQHQMGIQRQLEPMFADACLADPDRRAGLPLPIADPLTGAPAIVVQRDGYRYVNPEDVNLKALESAPRASSQSTFRKAAMDKKAAKKADTRAQTKKAGRAASAADRAVEPPELAQLGANFPPEPTGQAKAQAALKRPPPAPATPPKTAATSMWDLPSPSKKRRTLVSHKASSPERLRSLIPFCFGLPPLPQNPLNEDAGGGEGIQQQGSRQKAAIASGRSSSGSPAKSKARVPARQLSFDASSIAGGTPLTPAKTMTRRQQAIHDTHEAAALLTSCSRLPRQDREDDDSDNENRLMHFANVAILAELAGLDGPHRPDLEGLPAAKQMVQADDSNVPK